MAGQEEKKGVRLNKLMSEAGLCSRREADRLIEAGKVTVDGQKALLGTMVLEGQSVCVNGREIKAEEEKVLLVVNKPVGIVCTAEKREKNNIVDYLNFPKRIYPAGRLDKDSEGLLLMTNDGELMNKLIHARECHEKEYIVTVDKKITPEFMERMSDGVPILDTVTRKCKVEAVREKTFKIVLTQGLNRQIRRMCEYCGYRVVRLKRTRIMNITLGNLKPGEYRQVSKKELEQVKELLFRS